MIFLTQADLLGAIDAAQLDAAIKGNAAKYDISEKYALETISTILSGKYDCEAIFAQTGAERHPLILDYAISITIWHLLKNGLNPRNLPEIRKENSDQAISLLKVMANDKSNPNLPLVNSKVKSSRVFLAGKKRVSHRW